LDSKETVAHTVITSAASVADKHMLLDLLHGEKKEGENYLRLCATFALVNL
jgi:hypothetical protein